MGFDIDGTPSSVHIHMNNPLQTHLNHPFKSSAQIPGYEKNCKIQVIQCHIKIEEKQGRAIIEFHMNPFKSHMNPFKIPQMFRIR